MASKAGVPRRKSETRAGRRAPWNIRGQAIKLLPFFFFFFFLGLFLRNNVRVYQGWTCNCGRGQEQVASETARKWEHEARLKGFCMCRQVRICVCVCVHIVLAHTHRWQRNLAEALICRLDAGLSFLLAAAPCYRSFSTTLELITFTWRGQLTDNIVKTFLLLEGLSHGSNSPEQCICTGTCTPRHRNICLLCSYSMNAMTTREFVIGGGSVSHTEISIVAARGEEPWDDWMLMQSFFRNCRRKEEEERVGVFTTCQS